MKRFLRAVSVTAVFYAVVLVSFSVSAEEARVQVMVDQEVTAAQAACIRACLSGRDPSVVPNCVPANQEDLQRRRASARSSWRRLRDRLRGMEDDIGSNRSAIVILREQVTALQGLEDFYRELEGRVDELEGRVDDHEERITQLEDADDRHSTAIGVNSVAISRIEERVTALEEDGGRRMFQLGFQGGGGVVYSMDSTLYSFGFVGARLGIHARHNLDVVFDVQIALSGGDHPIGARVAGGLAIEFLDNRLRLDVGVEAVWAGYDSHADAGSIFALGGIGLEFRPHWVIGLGARVLLGLEMDPDLQTEFAVGGLGTVTFYLPRW